jgi:hypothetical protein
MRACKPGRALNFRVSSVMSRKFVNEIIGVCTL